MVKEDKGGQMDIRNEMEKNRADLEDRYTSNFYAQYNGMLKSLGPNLKGVYNSYTWYRIFTSAVRPYLITINPTYRMGEATYAVDVAKLAKGASDYATSVIDTCVAKIEHKLGQLENATCKAFSGFSYFDIEGTRNGHTVHIRQTMIVNVSKLGMLFNQFPARINVDGKAISEAKYKSIVS
jgi:hypothetical protein